MTTQTDFPGLVADVFEACIQSLECLSIRRTELRALGDPLSNAAKISSCSLRHEKWLFLLRFHR